MTACSWHGSRPFHGCKTCQAVTVSMHATTKHFTEKKRERASPILSRSRILPRPARWRASKRRVRGLGFHTGLFRNRNVAGMFNDTQIRHQRSHHGGDSCPLICVLSFVFVRLDLDSRNRVSGSLPLLPWSRQKLTHTVCRHVFENLAPIVAVQAALVVLARYPALDNDAVLRQLQQEHGVGNAVVWQVLSQLRHTLHASGTAQSARELCADVKGLEPVLEADTDMIGEAVPEEWKALCTPFLRYVSWVIYCLSLADAESIPLETELGLRDTFETYLPSVLRVLETDVHCLTNFDEHLFVRWVSPGPHPNRIIPGTRTWRVARLIDLPVQFTSLREAHMRGDQAVCVCGRMCRAGC
jgi:hypothetical protein